MSLECSECEADMRGGHLDTCSRHPLNKRIADLEEALADAVGYADSGLLIPYTRAKKWKIILGRTKENEG